MSVSAIACLENSVIENCVLRRMLKINPPITGSNRGIANSPMDHIVKIDTPHRTGLAIQIIVRNLEVESGILNIDKRTRRRSNIKTLHPNFKEIIESMHEQYSIIPNYTTNGILLDPNLIRFSVDHCGAIALSYHKNREVASLDKMRMLSDSGANAVLHVVANKSTLFSYDSIAQKFGEAGVKAIAFLLFKPAGRGKVLENEILSFEDREILDEKFRRVIEIAHEYEFIVGFDTCFAPYLATFSYSLKGTYDSCTGSRVSAYIDWDLSVRPCSFMQEEKGESLRNKTLQDIWWGNYFNDFRKSLLRANRPYCQKCSDFLYCFGGCPFFPEIVLCNRNATLL